MKWNCQEGLYTEYGLRHVQIFSSFKFIIIIIIIIIMLDKTIQQA